MTAITEPDLSQAVTQLMKGVVYRDTHEKRLAAPACTSSRRCATTSPCSACVVVIDEAEG